MARSIFDKMRSKFRGKRRWLILLVGLLAGLSLSLLNAFGAAVLNREADTIAEGLILFLLTVLAASLWLERNALLLSEQRARKLGELSAGVNAPYKPVEILQTAITALVTLMEMDAGGIGLLDRENETSVIIQAEYLQEGTQSSLGDRVLLDAERAPWAMPLWRGEAVIVPDINQSDVLDHLREIFERRGTRTLLALPLFADGRLYGSLGLHSLTPRSFKKNELNFARSATAIVTNAVAKAERLAQAQRHAAHLAVADAVAQRLLASNDIKHLSQQVADTLSRYFPNWNIYIFIKQRDEDVLALAGISSAYTMNVEVESFRLPIDEGPVGQTYRDQQIVLVNNVRGDPRFVAGDDLSPTRAELAVPIKTGMDVLGVLDVQSEQVGDFTREDVSILQNVALDVGTALVNAQLMEKAHQHHVIVERLTEVTKQALSADTLDEMLPALCAATCEAVGAYQASIMLVDQKGFCYRWAGHHYDFPLEPHPIRPHGISTSVLRSRQALFIPDLYDAQNTINRRMIEEGLRASACLPLSGRGELLGVIWINFRVPHVFEPGEQAILTTFAAQAGLIIEQLQQLETARRRLWELESLQTLSAALRKTANQQAMLDTLLDTVLSVFNIPHGSILLPDSAGENLRFVAARGWPQRVADLSLPVKASLSGRAFRAKVPFLSLNLMSEPEFSQNVTDRVGEMGHAGMFAPIRDEAETVGVIFVGCDLPRQFNAEDLKLLETFSEMAGTALRREALRAETEMRLSQLEALHQIDIAISSSFDLRFILNALLEQATRQLRVAAMSVLLLNPHSKMLELSAGRGLPASMTENVRLTLGTEYAGRVAFERRLIRVDNLVETDTPLWRAIQKAGAAFRSYLGVPLIVKGEIKGVLEIFHSAALPDDPDWTHFVETLAGGAAIAIDNAQLFEDVQRSTLALSLAYEKTIEGWSRALDLRDKETEGHTQRVTEMTLRLARAMGLSESELIHIRRGALLHDIGKMGVPDSILLKPDQLTAEEWEAMRKHPSLACEMLLPIEYLRPALDIPYCHHEKWDGTGYPRGLKGKAIPLSARIFAIVDVYDALTNDRPYRKAWTREKTLDYIKEQASKHFDPSIVQIFLILEQQEQQPPNMPGRANEPK